MTIPRLLVVDDDAETRAMLTQFLQQNGFMAHSAQSEAEIRACMQAGRVDLILLDVMLGSESGVEICARLRAEQDVPIILVSALSQDHQRMAGYEVGADDYVAKPFNPDLLLARVRAVLQRASRSASLAGAMMANATRCCRPKAFRWRCHNVKPACSRCFWPIPIFH